MPVLREVHPVRLVELRPDEEVEIRDQIVLAHERRRQPELAVRVAHREDPAERLRRHDVDLVEEHQTPLARLDGLDEPLAIQGPLAPEAHHVVRRDEHAALGVQVLLDLRREQRDPRGVQRRPERELGLPLGHGRRVRAQHERRPLHRRRRDDRRERLARAARQHDDAAPRAAVAEHLRQRLLLVGADLRGRSQIHGQHRVVQIVAEVVLLGQREVQIVRGELLHVLRRPDFELEGVGAQRRARRRRAAIVAAPRRRRRRAAAGRHDETHPVHGRRQHGHALHEGHEDLPPVRLQQHGGPDPQRHRPGLRDLRLPLGRERAVDDQGVLGLADDPPALRRRRVRRRLRHHARDVRGGRAPGDDRGRGRVLGRGGLK
mmetsp:Transcript_3893/g.12781  ORF Transcript_3893/g.12781 Transcript_3893/m.12781 type:complete len:375 (+) Transcript_3893:962-2086(+)